MLLAQQEKRKYFKMNRSANEFEFDLRGFYIMNWGRDVSVRFLSPEEDHEI